MCFVILSPVITSPAIISSIECHDTKRMKDVTYYERGLQFGAIEFRFVDTETAYSGSLNTIETEGWMLFPVYMEKWLVNQKNGGVPPEIRPEWLVAAALDDVEDTYNVVTLTRTETMLRRGFDVERNLQLPEGFRISCH